MVAVGVDALIDRADAVRFDAERDDGLAQAFADGDDGVAVSQDVEDGFAAIGLVRQQQDVGATDDNGVRDTGERCGPQAGGASGWAQ
ncbi:MAG: hypothetical protein U0992_12480 [Planctomycetaceae bacterium]